MKKKFSSSWKSSKQPRKQRKYRFNAPLHIRKKFMNSHVSAELRKKYGFRSVHVRKGDKVKVMRGQYKGKTGKVESINTKKSRVTVTGLDFTKKDGSKALYPVNASNLMITELITDDPRRFGPKEDKDKKIEQVKINKANEEVKNG